MGLIQTGHDRSIEVGSVPQPRRPCDGHLEPFTDHGLVTKDEFGSHGVSRIRPGRPIYVSWRQAETRDAQTAYWGRVCF